jgi:hypothetical protein
MDRPVIEPEIGRLLVASFHQSIAEMLPERLEFYEEWLKTSELRDGKMSRAPFGAALSFLRREGHAYDAVTTRAGECAAEWWAADVSAVRKRLILRAPAWARGRLALRAARTLTARTYRGSEVTAQWRREKGRLRVGYSLFCDVRDRTTSPLCGFYASAFRGLLVALNVEADVVVTSCHAVDGGACILTATQRADGVA